MINFATATGSEIIAAMDAVREKLRSKDCVEWEPSFIFWCPITVNVTRVKKGPGKGRYVVRVVRK